MGRPINKRYLGAGSGNQIRARAKLPGQAEGDGFIVSQRGTNKFRVNIGGVEGVCLLVNKDSGTLVDGEMIINVVDDTNTTVQATKLFNRVAIVEGNTKVKWNYDTNLTDGAVEVLDAVGLTITIDTQPTAQTTVSGEATFTIVASGAPGITYQWQERRGAGSYANLDGETSDTLVLSGIVDNSHDTWTYRCIVSAENADSVTSSPASLTFGS